MASNKKPQPATRDGVLFGCLTMTYSHMGRPHTTIGAEHFHFLVRDGIRWYTLAMVVRQFGADQGQSKTTSGLYALKSKWFYSDPNLSCLNNSMNEAILCSLSVC